MASVAEAGWLRLTLRVRAENLEAVVAQLWALGTIGVEERVRAGRTHLLAYFPTGARLPAAVTELGESYWNAHHASLDAVDAVSRKDWSEEYRRQVRPFPLGRLFWVDPREPGGESQAPNGGRTLLRLPAREAFGTGSHESTRLVVSWLEDLELGGLRVLDVGTGTGILAFVALHRGAAGVVAVEIDPGATFMALANQKLNGMAFPLVAGSVDTLDLRPTFDLALVNVLPRRIADAVPRLRGLVRPGGSALFSGILERSSDRYLAVLEGAGFNAGGCRVDGEWQAWMTERIG